MKLCFFSIKVLYRKITLNDILYITTLLLGNDARAYIMHSKIIFHSSSILIVLLLPSFIFRLSNTSLTRDKKFLLCLNIKRDNNNPILLMSETRAPSYLTATDIFLSSISICFLFKKKRIFLVHKLHDCR